MLLLEREIERSLDVAERSAAATLCAAIGGHPLRILQAAALIREQGISPDEWARIVTQSLIAEAGVVARREAAARVVGVDRAAWRAAAPLQHVSGIAEVPDIEPSLTALVRRGLVVSSQSRYQLADGVGDRLRRTEDLKPWVNRAITYFTAWAERHPRRPDTCWRKPKRCCACSSTPPTPGAGERSCGWAGFSREPLVVGARWGAWAITLERCLAAAKATRRSIGRSLGAS